MADTRRDWSAAEVDAVVADYFAMLELELRGVSFSKTEHRQRLREQLSGRSDGSVEYKHQNISAVMLDLGMPPIDGYKPASNYQELLYHVVEERLTHAAGLLAAVREQSSRGAVVPSVDDILSRIVERPSPPEDRSKQKVREAPGGPNIRRTDYLLQEARNASLGAAGEQFVLRYEQAVLIAAGEERLAAAVEQVSLTRGDSEGYDILSFEPDGRERLIEVKTTGFGMYTPFYVSENQVRCSQRNGDRYYLHRVFRFRRDPRLFSLAGALDQNCDLRASEYVARLT